MMFGCTESLVSSLDQTTEEVKDSITIYLSYEKILPITIKFHQYDVDSIESRKVIYNGYYSVDTASIKNDSVYITRYDSFNSLPYMDTIVLPLDGHTYQIDSVVTDITL